MYIGGYVYGVDDESRLWRRTMARYLCLTQLLVYRDISVRVRKRFPTYDSIIEAGKSFFVFNLVIFVLIPVIQIHQDFLLC